MKTNLLQPIGFAIILLVIHGCGSQTDRVDSGIYQGVVKEVEADKNELYVETEDNHTLELYFTEATTLTQAGRSVEFSALQEGQKVEVEVVNVGGSLNPISIRILE